MIEFTFDNTAGSEPNTAVFATATDDLAVRISRVLRTTPLSGMKQPALNGAILGMFHILQVAMHGRPVIMKWRLFKNGKLIQRGVTDQHGCYEGIKIDLPSEINSYRLELSEAAKKRSSRVVLKEPVL
jgi:hypothetical protein